MKATKQIFSIEASDQRIRQILESDDGGYADSDAIPNFESLTYDNGFYVDCAAVFIDIRGSTSLPKKHSSPVLGKIYRAYISECIAVLNQDTHCGEIFIQGDCVGAVFHIPVPEAVDSVFRRAAELNSLIEHLNWRLSQLRYTQLVCGIGMAVGRALMIKAGYKGSGINDIVWMGNVVNEAAKLCHLGNRDGRGVVQVSAAAFGKLSKENQALLSETRAGFGRPIHHQGTFVSNDMAGWTKQLSGARDSDLTKLGKWMGIVDEPQAGGLRKVPNEE